MLRRAIVCCAACLTCIPSVAAARVSKPGASWVEDGIPPSLLVFNPSIGPDASGSTWLADNEWLGRLDASGRVTLSYQSRFADVVGLASGPAGAIWELRSFGRESLESEVLLRGGQHEMRIPLAGVAGGIVADGEGGAWATLVSPMQVQIYTDISGQSTYTSTGAGSRIAHIAANGSVAEIPVRDQVNDLGLPDIVQGLGPIAVGADGNLWLIESEVSSPPPYNNRRQRYSTRLVRVTRTGAVRSWSMGTRTIRGLAAGPGGVWFTADDETIGQVSNSGRIVVFSDRLAGSRPAEIVAGPGDSMWFTERGFNAVGSINRRGVVRQHTWAKALVRGHDYAGAIANGSDGTLWIYRPYFDDLGHLSIDPACAVPRVIGMTLARALVRLHKDGCRMGRVSGWRKPGGHAIVVAQRPLAGALKALGGTVSVRVQAPPLARSQCVPTPGQRVLLSDADALVLARLPSQGLVEFRVCRLGYGSLAVGHSESTEWESSEMNSLTLAGPYLAWRTSSAGRYDNDEEDLRLLNVETGQESSVGISVQQTGLVGEIALDPSGHLAWQRAFDRTFDSSMYEIQALTSQGVLTLETSSVDSLEGLHFDQAGHVSWFNGGVEHSVALAPAAS